MSGQNKSGVKSGKVTKNPFLNFLRDLRKSKGGLRMADVAKMGGNIWSHMSKEDKSPYQIMARNARKPSCVNIVKKKNRISVTSVPSEPLRSKIIELPQDFPHCSRIKVLKNGEVIN